MYACDTPDLMLRIPYSLLSVSQSRQACHTWLKGFIDFALPIVKSAINKHSQDSVEKRAAFVEDALYGSMFAIYASPSLDVQVNCLSLFHLDTF